MQDYFKGAHMIIVSNQAYQNSIKYKTIKKLPCMLKLVTNLEEAESIFKHQEAKQDKKKNRISTQRIKAC